MIQSAFGLIENKNIAIGNAFRSILSNQKHEHSLPAKRKSARNVMEQTGWQGKREVGNERERERERLNSQTKRK